MQVYVYAACNVQYACLVYTLLDSIVNQAHMNVQFISYVYFVVIQTCDVRRCRGLEGTREMNKLGLIKISNNMQTASLNSMAEI